MHEITDMDTYYELLADRRAARIYRRPERATTTREIRIIQGRGSRRRTARSAGQSSAPETAALAALITSTGSHRARSTHKETPA